MHGSRAKLEAWGDWNRFLDAVIEVSEGIGSVGLKMLELGFQ